MNEQIQGTSDAVYDLANPLSETGEAERDVPLIAELSRMLGAFPRLA